MIGAKVTVDVSGFAFLVAENKRRDVTFKGAQAGAKVLERTAKDNAPNRTGMLRKAQGVKTKKGGKGVTTSYAVQGARKRVERMMVLPGHKKPTRVVPAFYDHLVQGGTKPHSISKGQKLGRKLKSGQQVIATDQTGHKHPGARANPYRKRARKAAMNRIAAASLGAMALEEQRLIAKASKNAAI